MADELIFWLVSLLFLPFIIRERWRRHCERRSEAGAAKDQAVEELVRKFNQRLLEVKREDRLAS